MTQPLTTQDLETTSALPTEWNGSMCDDCGIIAVYTVSKDSFELNFCGHHIRKHADKLINDGFIITPEHYKL